MSSIKLTPNKTTLETNLENIEAPLEILDNYIRGAINNLNQSYNALWNLPDEQLLEVLNSLGVAKMVEIFETHYKHSTGLNSIMDDRGISGDRAICVRGRDITVDENGLFIFVPLVVEEPVIDIPVEEPVE